MYMRLLIFSFLILLSLSVRAQSTNDSISHPHNLKGNVTMTEGDGEIILSIPQYTRYDRKVFYRRRFWNSLIPTQIVAQNAGNMGLFSVGIGWDYGRHGQWETHLMWGLLPKYSSDRAKLTMTIKENYLPWRIQFDDKWMFNPLSCGIYFNTVFGDEFWKSQPDRYPKGYYEWMSTKYRVNIFVGERITFEIPENRRKAIKSLSLFYEISTCDLYIRSMWLDDAVTLWDIIGLSIGVKLQLM